MELWDLYDVHRQPLGRTHARGTPVSPGEYHIVVSIWTVNSNGNVLLTLRDSGKRSYPDTWENTGGSALSGETSRQAAVRELMEETGISAAEDELVFIDSITTRNAFLDHYLVRRDIKLQDLRLQPGETTDARWVTLEELDDLIASLALAKPIGEQFNEIRDTFLRLLQNE